MTYKPRRTYLYRVVSGTCSWSDLHGFRMAQEILQRHRQDEDVTNRERLEIERVELFPIEGHGFWRWRGGKWSSEIWTDPTSEDLRKWMK